MVVVYTDRACGRIVDFSSKPSCDLTLTHKVVAPIPSLTIVSIESDNSDVEIVLQDEEDDDTSEKKWAHGRYSCELEVAAESRTPRTAELPFSCEL